MRVVEFRYDIGSEVRIDAINALGKVDGLTLDNSGPMYRVVYWDGGVRNVPWLYAWEISPVNEVSDASGD
jgi:hypothetical protein